MACLGGDFCRWQSDEQVFQEIQDPCGVIWKMHLDWLQSEDSAEDGSQTWKTAWLGP